MRYVNPIIQSDYSDPDIIRVGEHFYMVASSFNHVPGVPVLQSENLVEWRLVNYVLPSLPFEKFDGVRHGDGVWAPSLRYRNGKFYCLISFPDEGVYVSETVDPCGKWSPLRPLIERAGLKSPCPVWSDGKCYIVFGFDRSRTGFSSKLAVVEADENLTRAGEEFTFVYDGRDLAPETDNPKIYRRGKYFYILASAGGAETGWQVALRSANVFGPYLTKVILMQGDTDVNGPHGGALVDLDDAGEKWAFVHYSDMGAYGKVLHLQPAIWRDDWVLCGKTDGEQAGVPVAAGDYPVDISTDYANDPSDEFEGERLSPVWQTPANPVKEWYDFKRGLKLNCTYYGGNSLSDMPQLFLQKVAYLNFSVKTKCRLNLINDGDEVGFVVFGKAYSYICVVRRDGRNYLEIRKGEIGGESDETLCQSQPYDETYVTFQASAKYERRNRLTYKFTFGGSAFTHKFYAERGAGTGAKIGIYARANGVSRGCGTFKFFRVVCTDNRVNKA